MVACEMPFIDKTLRKTPEISLTFVRLLENGLDQKDCFVRVASTQLWKTEDLEVVRAMFILRRVVRVSFDRGCDGADFGAASIIGLREN